MQVAGCKRNMHARKTGGDLRRNGNRHEKNMTKMVQSDTDPFADPMSFNKYSGAFADGRNTKTEARPFGSLADMLPFQNRRKPRRRP